MKIKIVRLFIAVTGFVLSAGYAAAQNTEHGSRALQVYYSDLNQTLSKYELSDVPFQSEQIIVAEGDSLLEIARRYRFRELDYFHLAAALYETNSQAFSDEDPSQLKIGATITLPDVEDLFAAQDRYEKLKLVGEELDFNNQDNQMRKALRWPFGKSLVMIGPYARDELPRNQEVTLTSYRPDSLSIKSDAPSDFLSSAANAVGGQQAGKNTIIVNGEQETVSRWLDLADNQPASEDALFRDSVVQEPAVQNEPLKITGGWFDQSQELVPIAETVPMDDINTLETVSLSDGLKTYSSWLDQSEQAEPIAQSLPLEEPVVEEKAVSPVVTAATDPVVVDEPEIVAATKAQSIETPIKQPEKLAAPKIEPVSETIALLKAEAATEASSVTESEIIATVDTSAVENESMEQPLSLPINSAAPLTDSVMTVVAAAKPALTRDSRPASPDSDKNFYLGPPRNAAGASSKDIPSDPLRYIVEWSFDDSVSVGLALNKLADYIGYELLSDDDAVLGTYSRQLPRMQLRVGGVTAEEGFAILAGRGLETVYDHVARSVKHVPRDNRPAKPVVKTAEVSKTHAKFMQQTGISAMLRQFPSDIQNAASRHANRCESSANTSVPEIERLYSLVVDNLRQSTQETVALDLVEWYDSPTGRKVLELERGDIDENALKNFEANTSRAARIQQIYNNTVTGKGIASIAVELDYAGWTLSGCKQKAEMSGDAKLLSNELIYGQRIKNKFVKLESILRGDMLRSMDYLFSSLSDSELSEYSDITMKHAGAHADLQKSIVDAIESETKGLM